MLFINLSHSSVGTNVCFFFSTYTVLIGKIFSFTCFLTLSHFDELVMHAAMTK